MTHTLLLRVSPSFIGCSSKPWVSSFPAAATVRRAGVTFEHLDRILCCSTSDPKSFVEGIFASESSRSPILHNSLLDIMSFRVFLASSFPFILV
ncbi:hypothetical protein GW17_00030474 [Ensete ventricosum]|nr:hypothetical protein GW17_00030474 [Ensete ventricosum]RZS04764.1 hypothetical protein BHM03_00035148 [Ensete ventricosum]